METVWIEKTGLPFVVRGATERLRTPTWIVRQQKSENRELYRDRRNFALFAFIALFNSLIIPQGIQGSKPYCQNRKKRRKI